MLLAWFSLWWCVPAAAGAQPYYLRNHSPFLQVFGLPAPEGGALTPPGTFSTRLASSLANHADTGENTSEAIVLDGETYYADLVLRYGLSERWELGLDLPYVAHRDGKLDNLIEGWHELFGLPNGERQRPSNELELAYLRDGTPAAGLEHPGGGPGDLRLTGAYQLAVTDDGGRAVALRGVVKLPTGDADRLRGSGATDVAVSLEGTDRITLADQSMELFAQAGVLYLGRGEVLPDQQKDAVIFASATLGWQWRPNVELRLQLAVQGEYFNSGLAELGAGTANVAAGGVIRLRRLGLELDIALIEDLISDATPDFGIHASLRRTLGTRIN